MLGNHINKAKDKEEGDAESPVANDSGADVEETKKNSGKLKLRVLSGILLAPLVIAIVYYGSWPFILLLGALFIVSVLEWRNMTKLMPHPIRHFCAGLVYIAFGFSAFAYCRFAFEEQGAFLALTLMLSVWASDTGAYVVGKRFGGKKLAPVTSPNKTWAGLIGSMVFAGLFMFVLFVSFVSSISVWWFVCGCVLGVVGQIGDLFVSQYKRRANLKDSGQLIPGHGGILDRIDASLLVAPVFLGFVLIWMM